MKLSREIAVYEKDGEQLIKNFEIDIAKSILIEILKIDIADDPDILKVYSLEESQYSALSKLILELQKYDFNEVEVFYECYQI